MAQAPESTERPTAAQIHDRARQDGEESLGRTVAALAISGFTAGLLMGLSGLGMAALIHEGAPKAIAALLYPLGFIAVILGRAQLFTENTLYPIVVLFGDRSQLGRTARLWAVVLTANVLGTLAFATLVTQTGGVEAGVREELTTLAEEVASGSFGALFWSAVLGGWMVALAAWLVLASDTALGRLALVFVATYPIAVIGLTHSIAGAAEVLSGVLEGTVALSTSLEWFVPAVLGNAVGGVLIVSLLNHGQVAAE